MRSRKEASPRNPTRPRANSREKNWRMGSVPRSNASMSISVSFILSSYSSRGRVSLSFVATSSNAADTRKPATPSDLHLIRPGVVRAGPIAPDGQCGRRLSGPEGCHPLFTWNVCGPSCFRNHRRRDDTTTHSRSPISGLSAMRRPSLIADGTERLVTSLLSRAKGSAKSRGRRNPVVIARSECPKGAISVRDILPRSMVAARLQLCPFGRTSLLPSEQVLIRGRCRFWPGRRDAPGNWSHRASG
jgi:hypothetical protein